MLLRTIEADLRSNVDPTRRTGLGFWIWVIGKAIAAPQVHVVMLFRLAHAVAQTPLRPLAFVIRSLGLAWSGAEIHPDAQLAPGLALAHSTGVMIGAHVKTGVDFRIYPGAVLGEPGRGSADAAGFPTFGDHVTIGAHAVVLGPIHVGHGSVVGANSVVTKDVPDNVIVAGAPAKVVRHLLPFEQDPTRSIPAPAPGAGSEPQPTSEPAPAPVELTGEH